MTDKAPGRFSRRILLRSASGAAVTAILSACGNGIATETPVNIAATVPLTPVLPLTVTRTPTPGAVVPSGTPVPFAAAAPSPVAAAPVAGMPEVTATMATTTPVPAVVATALPLPPATTAVVATALPPATTGSAATSPAATAGNTNDIARILAPPQGTRTVANAPVPSGTPTVAPRNQSAATTAPGATGIARPATTTGTVPTGTVPTGTARPAITPPAATLPPMTPPTPALAAQSAPRPTGVTGTIGAGNSATAIPAPTRPVVNTTTLPAPTDVSVVSAVITGNPGVAPPGDLAGKLSIKRVTIALPPADDRRKMLADYQELLAYLRVALGVEIVAVVTKSYADTTEYLRARKADLAFFNPVGYLLAHDIANMQPLLQGESGEGRPVVDNSFIIALTDSTANALTDLRGKEFAVEDGDPLSGHWVPQAIVLDRARLTEDKDYKISAYGKHFDVYTALMDKRQIMGAMSREVLQAGVDTNVIDLSTLKVLDTSFDIPMNMIAVRGDVPPTDQDIIAGAIQSINEQPRDSRLYKNTFFTEPRGQAFFGTAAVKFRRVDDTFYEDLRSALKRINLDFRDAATKLNETDARALPPPASPPAPTAVSATATPVLPTATAVPLTVTPPTAAPRANTATPGPTATRTTAAVVGPTTVPPTPVPPTPVLPTSVSPTSRPTTAVPPSATAVSAPKLSGAFQTVLAGNRPANVMVPTDLTGRLSLKQLTVALLPSNDPRKTLADNSEFLAYLRATFNIDVVGAATNSPVAVLNALKSKSIDFAFMSADQYIVAHDGANAQVVIQGEAPDGNLSTNNTVVIARADSSFVSLSDLASGNVGFVETDPVVGRVVPMYILLDRAKLTEGKDYSVTSVGSHADAYQAVLDGVIDAAAIASDVYQAGVAAGLFDGEAVKVLDTSFPVPQSLGAVRGDFSQADQELLALCFLTINEQSRDSKLYTSFVAAAPRGQGTFGTQTVKMRRGDDGSFSELRNAAMRVGFDLRKLVR